MINPARADSNQLSQFTPWYKIWVYHLFYQSPTFLLFNKTFYTDDFFFILTNLEKPLKYPWSVFSCIGIKAFLVVVVFQSYRNISSVTYVIFIGRKRVDDINVIHEIKKGRPPPTSPLPLQDLNLRPSD